MTANTRFYLESFALFCISLALFLFGLRHQELVGFDSRFYLFAQEMYQNGLSWFPTTYHQPYPDYPATATILMTWFAHFFGGIHKQIAVLPSALASAGTMVITYWIGALYQKRFGFYAVCFLVLTFTFFKSARAISLDMYSTLITTTCFYLLLSADRLNTFARHRLIYPLLLLGFAFRGPIGLVIPTGVVCSYYLVDGNFKACFTTGFKAFCLLMVSSLLLLALAYHAGGASFLQDVLRMEFLGRMQASALPFYFYFKTSFSDFALSFPLAAVVLSIFLYALLVKRDLLPERTLVYKLAIWLLIILLGMSIPGDKKMRYILPMTPAIALLAAYPFITKNKQFNLMRRMVLTCFYYFPTLLLLVSLGLAFYASSHGIPFQFNDGWPFALIFLQGILVWSVSYYQHNKEPIILFAAALSFAFTYITFAEPMELFLERGRDFVTAVEQVRNNEHAQLVFYKESPDGLPIKYLINMATRTQPIFIKDEKALAEVQPPAVVITSAAYYAAIDPAIKSRFSVVTNDTLGHIKVVAFLNKGANSTIANDT